ncbi:MAG: WG repeat-containing protein [Pirellulaceae bacterium]
MKTIELGNSLIASIFLGMLFLPIDPAPAQQTSPKAVPSSETQQPALINATKVDPANKTERALFEISVNGKHGFIDKDGKIVIEPKYEKVFPFSDGLAAVQVDERWGFIDAMGKLVIEPQFIQVRMFASGRAGVRLKSFSDRWGFIDSSGMLVIEPQFDCVEEFRNGIAKVGMETLKSRLLGRIADIGIECDYHYIDLQGNIVPEPPPEHFATGVPGELISFRKDGLMGFVDATGQVVIEPQFLAVGKFSEGLACATNDKLFGYIDPTGEFVIPPSFPYANEFSDGLAGVQIQAGKWGFIDKSGKLIIPANYNWVFGGFREGLAQVAVEGKLGYINKNAERVW